MPSLWNGVPLKVLANLQCILIIYWSVTKFWQKPPNFGHHLTNLILYSGCYKTLGITVGYTRKYLVGQVKPKMNLVFYLYFFMSVCLCFYKIINSFKPCNWIPHNYKKLFSLVIYIGDKRRLGHKHCILKWQPRIFLQLKQLDNFHSTIHNKSVYIFK